MFGGLGGGMQATTDTSRDSGGAGATLSIRRSNHPAGQFV